MKTRKLSVIAVVASLVLATLAGCSKKNEPVGTVTDACGNQYNYVKIGNQYWLAENMRCNRYDTQSELAGATVPVYTAPSEEELVYTPYYVDSSNRSLWSTDQFAGNLSADQVAKLGYLYNWGAAVGLETKSEVQEQAEAFSRSRQGICPNGWHIPTDAEWAALKNFIENTDGKGRNTAGKHLKTTSGWNESTKNDDIYAFGAFPSGRSTGSSVDAIGIESCYWTATPCPYTIIDLKDPLTGKVIAIINLNANYFYLSKDANLLYSNLQDKSHAKSVRCVKN